MLAIRRVLHPTDFSELSRPAFELACALARDYRADLLLLHVIPPALAAAPDGAVTVLAEEPERVRDRLDELNPADPRVTVEHRVAEGDPVEEIVNAARHPDVDLIVMGTHGRSGLRRLLMGSVAEGVTRRARCPVLTVRCPPPVHSGQTAEEQLVSLTL